VQGYVESISQDRLTLKGWVQLGQDGQEPRLQLNRNGEETGTAEFGLERPDVRAGRRIPNKAFILTLEEPLDGKHTIAESHRVIAAADGTVSTITLTPGAQIQLIADFAKDCVARIPQAREAILNALQVKERSLAHNLDEVRHTAQAGDLSYIAFPVGLRSSDDVAEIGRDGYLFLTGGNNALRDQYEQPKDAARAAAMEATAQQWVSGFQISNSRLQDRGVPFVQVIIPEKLTALRHLAPFPVDGPTPLYARVNQLMSGEPYYLSCLELFDAWSSRISGWQRNDTHCSPAGALAIARATLERLPGCETSLLAAVKLTGEAYHDGDLANKFFDIPIWDRHRTPAPGTLGEPDIELTYKHVPANFVGSRFAWKNKTAPIDKKVVVFGNSFFGSGVDQPSKIGWWFARLFSEYHFVWDNTVDFDYVDEVRPDYVVSQTIERFLVQAPEIPANT
jgi:hypothetical protein